MQYALMTAAFGLFFLYLTCLNFKSVRLQLRDGVKLSLAAAGPDKPAA